MIFKLLGVALQVAARLVGYLAELTMRCVNRCCCSLILAMAMVAGAAAVQGYPTKSIRMIVGFSPGGGTDIVARIIVPRLSERMHQQIVLDNRPGATGIIGANLVAKSTPDGYTVLMGSVSSNAIAASMFRNLPFDLKRDFAPITLAASVPHLIVVHPSLDVKSVKDLIAYAKTRPGKLFFPSAGIGTSSHLAGEIFKMMSGTDMVHVPYKGAGQSMQDQLAGQTKVAFNTVPAAVRYVKAGNLNAVAVLALHRSPLLPEVPTIGESGVPGAEATTWYGLFAPAGTSPQILHRLHAEVNAVIRLPDVKDTLVTNGADETVTRSPAEFTKLVNSEIVRYAKVVKVAGVSPD